MAYERARSQGDAAAQRHHEPTPCAAKRSANGRAAGQEHYAHGHHQFDIELSAREFRGTLAV